jgi:hypothetical protein
MLASLGRAYARANAGHSFTSILKITPTDDRLNITKIVSIISYQNDVESLR